MQNYAKFSNFFAHVYVKLAFFGYSPNILASDENIYLNASFYALLFRQEAMIF